MAVMASNARNSRGKIDLLAMNNDAVLTQAQGILSAPQLAAFRRMVEQTQMEKQREQERAKAGPPPK